MSCAIWSNEIVRKVELTECRMLLDSFADGDKVSETFICALRDPQENCSFVQMDSQDISRSSSKTSA